MIAATLGRYTARWRAVLKYSTPDKSAKLFIHLAWALLFYITPLLRNIQSPPEVMAPFIKMGQKEGYEKNFL